MSEIKARAQKFFDACERGEGWTKCSPYCDPEATFASQAAPLADVKTLQEYTEWMKGIVGLMPDADYEVRSFAEDPERGNVSAYGIFRGTHTGEGGPVPPTGKRVETDYVYVMEFDGDRIRHMTKIWNAPHALEQVGWA